MFVLPASKHWTDGCDDFRRFVKLPARAQQVKQRSQEHNLQFQSKLVFLIIMPIVIYYLNSRSFLPSVYDLLLN